MSSGETSSAANLRSRKTAAREEVPPSTGAGIGDGGGGGIMDLLRALAPLLVIITIALSMLVFGYIFVPPFQKTSTPDSLCTHITDIPTVLSSLKDFDKWNKLSIELRIAGSESGAKNGDSVSVLERWFEKKESVCWETLIAALQTLGYGGLADQVAQKYLPN